MKWTRSMAVMWTLAMGCARGVDGDHDFGDGGPGTDGSDGTGGGTDPAPTAPDDTSSAGDSTGDTGSDADEDTADASSDGTSAGGVPTTPVARDDDFVVAQNALPLTVTAPLGLFLNDSDDDGDPLLVAGFDAETLRGGDVVVDDDGGFSYDAPPWIWGEDEFTYRVEDPDGNVAEATVRILVRPTEIRLQDVGIGRGGFSIAGESTGDFAGIAVDGGPDANADGRPDFLIGAFGADPNGGVSGRTYVYTGDTTGPVEFLANVTTGQEGWRVDGEAAADMSGQAARFAGDVDGDGAVDIIVGAPGSAANGTSAGRAYVVFGSPDTSAIELSNLAASGQGFAIEAEMAGDIVGLSVAAAGDVNADGLADVVVGAPYAPGGEEYGRAYVIFGKTDSANVSLADIAAGIGGFAIAGEDDGDRAGFSVAAAGDVDGDGAADLIIGALRADPNGASSGRAYVVFGGAVSGPVDLVQIVAGIGGFAIDGTAAGDQAGAAVAGIGDINADGLDDVLVGAPGYGDDAGAAYVVFGRAATATVDTSMLEAANEGFAIVGAVGDNLGSSLGSLGDADADGYADVVVGAPSSGASPAGDDGPGRVYVVYGKPSSDTVDAGAMPTGDGFAGYAVTGIEDAHQIGVSTAGVGDLDLDGWQDLIVGGTGSSTSGAHSGNAYVVFGTRRDWP